MSQAFVLDPSNGTVFVAARACWKAGCRDSDALSSAVMLRVLTALLCAVLPAQRTFVIDAANGAGTNFTDLPAALQQAQHGDVYLVRAGTYSPAATDKGVSLLGSGSVTISPTATPVLLVQNLPLANTFVISGFTAAAQSPGTWLSLRNNSGRVQLEDLSGGALYAPDTSIEILQCRSVTMSHCSLLGTVQVTDSTLFAVNTNLFGGRPDLSRLYLYSSPALVGTRSTIQLYGGFYGGGTCVQFGRNVTPPCPGVSLTSCQLIAAITDRSLTLSQSNEILPYVVPAAPAVVLASTQVLVDPRVTLRSRTIPYAVSGSTTALVRSLPSLVAATALLGANNPLTFLSSPGDSYLVAAGLPADPLPMFEGLLCLDPSTLVTIAMGTQSASGTLVLGVGLPNDAALRGLVIGYQAASHDSVANALVLTNPSPRVLQ